MLKIECRTSPGLKIRRSMAKLFQSYLYSLLPEQEHEGYKHPSGKRFKASNFRIRYEKDRFEICFVSLNQDYEKIVAMAILKEGLRLGEVHVAQSTVALIEREPPGRKMMVRGHVCAAIKNPLTGRKIFLEPGESRHTEIITRHSLQKYEALLGKSYTGELSVTPRWQSPRSETFWYDKSAYTVWNARYEIEAEPEMLDLLLRTGLGSDTMKNLGYLEILPSRPIP